MTKEELKSWLTRHGYKEDKYGHFQRTSVSGEVYRYKLQDISVRLEHKAKIGDHNEWMRISSGYLANLKIDSKDQLSGLGK